MTSTDLIILNFEEIRRRSILLWNGMPEKFFNWQPDQYAMSSIEMVRHVLEGEYEYHKIIENRGSQGLDITSPWKDRAYTTIAEEIAFAQPFRLDFIETVRSFSEQDLNEVRIIRSDLGQSRSLGDYLLRVAYHESVHSGQMLSYLRTLNIPRPNLWD